jgi:hypothetical protein
MYHVNIFAFYNLGGAMKGLAPITHGGRFVDHEGLLRGTQTLLLRFTGGEFLPLARCLPWAKKLDDAINEILSKYSQRPDTFIDFIDSDDRKKVIVAAVEFERELGHELAAFDVYHVPPKGTHATLALIEKAEANLPADVVSRFDSKTLNDVRQAGRCLALDAPTAAGFHILRAVESVIVKYIDKLTGKSHAPKNRNWGVYIKAIRDTGGKTPVADYLYHMKETYRNPIMHPEIVLTPDDAFSLFNASLSAIVQLDNAIQSTP